MLLCLLQSLRPKQWPKNLLVFAGLLFTINQPHGWTDVAHVTAAFVIFCLLSGGIYVINDIVDIENDRRHPRKRTRPIAGGKLAVGPALAAAVILMFSAVIASFALDFGFGLTALGYIVLSATYCFVFKHMVIVDVLAIAAGFVLRAVAGALVIDVVISEWLLVCTTLLALFLGLAKRRNELIILDDEAASHRKILNEYTPALLDQMIVITASCTVMAYMLYTFLSATGEGSHHYMMATIPFVIYGLFRYLYLVHNRSLGGSPESILIEDKPLLVNLLLFITTVVAALVLAA